MVSLLSVFGCLLLGLIIASNASQQQITSQPQHVVSSTSNLFPVYVSRLPKALKESSVSGLRAFVSNSAILIPIGIVGAAFNKPESISAVIKSGCQWGVKMSSYSGTFAVGEQFCKSIRDVDDSMNRMVGSGLASAVGRRHEGSVPMIQGFVSGAAFMFALDKWLMPSPKNQFSQVKGDSILQTSSCPPPPSRKWLRNPFSV